MIRRRPILHGVVPAVFYAVILLGPLSSRGEGLHIGHRQQPEPSHTTTTGRAETREAWIIEAGGGVGSLRQTITYANTQSSGSNPAIGLGVMVGRGVTNRFVLDVALATRVGVSPVFLEAVEIGTITVSASYYPFETAGLFVSIGGGYGAVHYERVPLFGPKRDEDASGYVILGAVGYEWRVDETFAVDARFAAEHYQLDAPFDKLRLFLVAVGLRVYV